MTSMCGASSPRAAQRVALLDPEAVLLVDHDQPEVGEPDVVLDQRVRADHDAGRAGLRVQQRLPAGLGAQRAGEQGDPGGLVGRAQLRRPCPSGPSSARSERACWAASTSVGASSAACRPASTTCSIARSAIDRLARADVALHQPVHRVRARPGRRRSRAPTATLARGQRERQPGVEGVEQPAGRRRAGRRRAGRRWPAGAAPAPAARPSPRPRPAGCGRRGGRRRSRARGSGAAPGPARPGPRRRAAAAGSGSVGSSSTSSTWRTQLADLPGRRAWRWPGRSTGTAGRSSPSSSGSNCGWVSCSLPLEHADLAGEQGPRRPGLSTARSLCGLKNVQSSRPPRSSRDAPRPASARAGGASAAASSTPPGPPAWRARPSCRPAMSVSWPRST